MKAHGKIFGKLETVYIRNGVPGKCSRVRFKRRFRSKFSSKSFRDRSSTLFYCSEKMLFFDSNFGQFPPFYELPDNIIS